MNYPSVTIGFTARERFNLAAKALKQIYKNTEIPFNLIVVDCNTPKKYLSEMMAVLKDKPTVKILHTDNYLKGNQARNLVLKNTTDEYIAFIENDCFPSKGWLSKLISACEEFPAGAAIPLLLEEATWRKNVHHDTKLAQIKTMEENGKIFHEFVEDFSIQNRYKETARQRVWSMEMHTMFFKRSVFDIIGPFDEKVLADATYEYIDISLSLLDAGIPIVCEPTAQVNFYNPPPVYADELPFYDFTWNLNQVIDTKNYLTEKWGILNMHDSTGFVSDQLHRTSYFRWLLRKVPGKIARTAKKLF